MADFIGGDKPSTDFFSLFTVHCSRVEIPKAPPNPYVLFYIDQIRGKDVTKENLGEHSTAVSKVWQGYTLSRSRFAHHLPGAENDANIMRPSSDN